jgi:hypothetical protein
MPRIRSGLSRGTMIGLLLGVGGMCDYIAMSNSARVRGP